MEDLTFSIAFKNGTFNIYTNHKTTNCSYNIEGKYKTSLIFASNTYAHVEYKNIKFSGTVIKRNIWNIFLDFHPVVRKYYDSYYFESTKAKNIRETDNVIEDIQTEYPKNILYLYEQLTSCLYELYVCIENKEKFRRQLCDCLRENYDEVENLDEIIEYENWDNVETEDDDPIIETGTIRNMLVNECKSLFVSFRQAEIDNKNKKSIITLENVVEELSELKEVPNEFLHKEFSVYFDENYDDLIEADIYYDKKDLLYTVGKEIYESYKYFVFIRDLEVRIDKILLSSGVDGLNKEELCFYLKTKYSKGNVPSEDEFKRNVTDYINDYVAFKQLYSKFLSLFNSDNIALEWDDNKVRLFQKYDNKELPVADEHVAEFEVYKYIIPYYKKHLFIKNTNKYKPSINQLPDFIAYASSVLDVLFEFDILIDNGDCVIYNENGNTHAAYEEIERISAI